MRHAENVRAEAMQVDLRAEEFFPNGDIGATTLEGER
jgi:hypothetical protein